MAWDGRGWRLQSTPEPKPGSSPLAGVSCTSRTLCVAVGEYLQSVLYDPTAMHTVPILMPFTERWDGVGWSLLPFPSLPAGGEQGGLQAVSCTSGGGCIAVGRYFGQTHGLFAERWDGRDWSLESMPEPVSAAAISDQGAPYIGGLSCSSSRSCTVVGYYDLNVSGVARTFAERWDGSSWSLESTRDVAGAFATELSGVSCTSPHACVAVGEFDRNSSPGGGRTLVGGTRWAIQSTARAREDGLQFQAVSCASGVVCTAVGNTRADGVIAEQSLRDG
jgi:hypothetical protein